MFDYDAFNLFFKDVTLESLSRLDDFYHPQIVFIDPAHHLHGIPEIRRFWTDLLETVLSCETDVLSSTRDGDSCFSQWRMRIRHPKIGRGRAVEVDGMSALLLQDEMVIRHQDYFDMGALLYENLPVLGTVIRAIKRAS